MTLIIDTVKFSILTAIAVAFAAIGVAVTSLLGIKRSASVA